MPRSHPPYPIEFRNHMIELIRAGRTPEEVVHEVVRAPHTRSEASQNACEAPAFRVPPPDSLFFPRVDQHGACWFKICDVACHDMQTMTRA